MHQVASEIFRRGRSLDHTGAAAQPIPLKPRRSLATATILGLLVLAMGCALTQATRQSLTTYTRAMDEVQESANFFLTDYANLVKFRKQLEAGGDEKTARAKPEFPSEFILPQNPGAPTTKAEKAIQESREALEVIRQYNDALVALAEGRPEAEIKAQINQFGGALQTLASIGGTVVPGIEQFSDIATKIIKLAQDADNREQFKKAVKEGQKPVNNILTALEKQTSPIYRASVPRAKSRQDVAKDNIRLVGFEIKPFLADFSPPTDPGLSNEMAEFRAEIVAIGTRTKTIPPLPDTFPFQSGKPEYDNAAHANMNIFMQVLRVNDALYTQIVTRQNAYYNLMVKYVALLRQTRRSLTILSDSLDAPIDIEREAYRLINVAFELRDAIAVFRNPPVAAGTI
ncbi:hypothetical protein JY97_05075 [Alkalispirochaeta odontotermitis]|nr:hypothetical protein JY97_05075 [Alkalispirochaeta odontotermitis]CAB1080272.1 hypothetical protein D1AOALGA4SA_7956 [Olavius algarvensis Delta 1 endosymbiont]